MSSFETGGQEYDPNQKNTEPITEFDRRIWASIAKMGQFTPKDFKSYMLEWLTLNQPLIPVGQLVGYSQQIPQAATTISTAETTASTSYTNLATTGPELTGLPDGVYIVYHGCQAKEDTGGVGALMSYSVNGAAASDTVLAQNAGVEYASVMRASAATLDAGSNTLTAKYRVGGAATGSFADRWLIAVRVTSL